MSTHTAHPVHVVRSMYIKSFTSSPLWKPAKVCPHVFQLPFAFLEIEGSPNNAAYLGQAGSIFLQFLKAIHDLGQLTAQAFCRLA